MGDTPTNVSEYLDLVKKYGFEYFGVYYGTYRGFVIDNRDPDHLGRLKLNIPQISAKNIMQTWAWPRGQIAGKDFGSFIIPPKGAMVWVSFENGDPSHPLWEGGAWSKGNAPQEAKNNPPDNRVIKTKNWVLEMDDTEGSEKFRITDIKKGSVFEFDTATGNLNLTVKGDHNVSTQGNSGHEVNGNRSSSVSGNTVVINGGGVFIQGRQFLAHTHNGVDPGGGSSGGVN